MISEEVHLCLLVQRGTEVVYKHNYVLITNVYCEKITSHAFYVTVQMFLCLYNNSEVKRFSL